MLKKIKNKVVAIIVVMAVMMSPMLGGAILSAATPLEKNQPIFTDVTDNVKADLVNRSVNGENFKKLKKKYNIDIDTSDNSKIIVKKLPDYSDLTIVSIPIPDNTGYNFSKILEFYDGKGELKNWQLLKFSKKENNIYSLHEELQSGATLDADATENGEIVEGSLIETGLSKELSDFLSKGEPKPSIISKITNSLDIQPVNAGQGYSCVNDCVASLGIPTWTLALIGVGCGIACGGTLGLGCSICWMAVTAGFGYEIGYCLRYCGY
jgi:hypothetical protein